MTPVEQVCLLATGTKTGQPSGCTEPLFTSDELAYFLEAEGENVKLAAALALETIAASAARVALIVNSGQFQSSSTSVPVQLRASAQQLRDTVRDNADNDAYSATVYDHHRECW